MDGIFRKREWLCLGQWWCFNRANKISCELFAVCNTVNSAELVLPNGNAAELWQFSFAWLFWANGWVLCQGEDQGFLHWEGVPTIRWSLFAAQIAPSCLDLKCSLQHILLQQWGCVNTTAVKFLLHCVHDLTAASKEVLDWKPMADLWGQCLELSDLLKHTEADKSFLEAAVVRGTQIGGQQKRDFPNRLWLILWSMKPFVAS